MSDVDELDLLDADYAVLDRLPKQGEKAGYHPLAATVAHLARELGGGLTSDILNGRLREMRHKGLVVDVRLLAGKTKGWQITPLGEQALTRRRGNVVDIRQGEVA